MEARLSINAHFAPPIVDLNEPASDCVEATSSLATFAPEDYCHHLEGSGLTEAEQNELLAALWKIMCGFVDLGWNVDAVSLVLGATSPSPQDATRIDGDCERSASSPSGAR
jgi:hypothetical protein